jgi:hypothetical protein
MIKRKWLGLFVLFIPVTFLVITAVVPDRYVVNQNIDINDDAPVALMTDPVGYMSFKQMMNDTVSFFINSYTVTKLESDIVPGWANKQKTPLGDMVRETMSIKKIDDKRVQVVYSGKNRELGQILVGFYAERLLKKAHEGLIRSNTVDQGRKPQLAGNINTVELKSLWRSDRTLPLMYCIGVSMVLVLILFGFIEWNDSALKSERQRSEERRVGKECRRLCRSRWSPYH